MVPYRDAVDGFSMANGLHVNSVRVVVVLVASLAVAPFTHFLRTSTTRHLANVLLGLSFAWFCLDVQVLHSLAATVFTYATMQFAPRSQVGVIVAVAVFAHLFYANAMRELFLQDIMWDAAHMVLTLKLVGTAISYTDGADVSSTMSRAVLRNQLAATPSLLALLGYVYFFPTFFAGPVFEFNDYVKWVDERRAASWGVHGRNLVFTLICIGGYVVSDQLLPVHTIDTLEFYPTTSHLGRLLLQCMAVMFYRFKFYLVWQLGETAANVAGYGYLSDSNAWDGLRNNDLLLVELPTNFRVAITSWNIRVSVWLNTYVYHRVGLRNNRPTGVSTAATFLVSALWHGFLPGYYQFFFMGAVYLELGKHIRRRFRPYFHYTEDRKAHPYAIFWEYLDSTKAHPLAVVYDVGGMVLTWVLMQYIGASFVLQDMPRCVGIWSGFYFVPHIVPLVLVLCFAMTEQKRTKEA